MLPKYFLTSGDSNSLKMRRLAELNVLLLSEITLEGTPRCAVNVLKHHKKALTVMSGTSSRWMARVTQQVNRLIKTLLVSFKYRGPA